MEKRTSLAWQNYRHKAPAVAAQSFLSLFSKGQSHRIADICNSFSTRTGSMQNDWVCRAAGRIVSLPPKALKTLLTMAKQDGQVVGKEELMEAVWRTASWKIATSPRTSFVAPRTGTLAFWRINGTVYRPHGPLPCNEQRPISRHPCKSKSREKREVSGRALESARLIRSGCLEAQIVPLGGWFLPLQNRTSICCLGLRRAVTED